MQLAYPCNSLFSNREKRLWFQCYSELLFPCICLVTQGITCPLLRDDLGFVLLWSLWSILWKAINLCWGKYSSNYISLGPWLWVGGLGGGNSQTSYCFLLERLFLNRGVTHFIPELIENAYKPKEKNVIFNGISHGQPLLTIWCLSLHVFVYICMPSLIDVYP